MKLILQAIKALFRKVENAIEDVRKSIPEAVQSDWSQSDRNAPDYVKNRTHYEGIIEVVLSDGNTSNEDAVLHDTYSEVPLLEEGLEYTVVVDGIRYELVAFHDNNFDIVALGAPTNPSEEWNWPPNDFDFSEYPFGIISFYDEPWVLRARFSDNKKHSLYIARFEEGIQKLDSKYLPDNLATTEQLEDVQKDVRKVAEIIPDLDQNDADALDYVKGRTHYRTIVPSSTIKSRSLRIVGAPLPLGDPSMACALWHFGESCFLRYGGTGKEVYLPPATLVDGRKVFEVPIPGMFTVILSVNPDLNSFTYEHTSSGAFECTLQYPLAQYEYHKLGLEYLPNAIGDGTVANFAGMTANGTFNKYSDVYERIEKNVIKSTPGSGIYCAVADSYTINKENGYYELVNPTLRQGLYSAPVGKYIMSDFTGSLYAGDFYKSKNVYEVVEQKGGNDDGWSIVVDAYTVFIENTTDRGEFIHVVGNGTSDTDRSNAHTLDWEGNAWYAGSVEGKAMILPSTSEGSTKRFKVTVDDSGTLTATEMD